MNLIYRLIRIYTPFICGVMSCRHGKLFLEERLTEEFEYLSSAYFGFSILVVLYFFSTSRRMCIWYKLNLTCLLLTQIWGLLYDYYGFDQVIYMNGVVWLTQIGVVFFLIFRIFYKVTATFGCNHRY